MPETKKVAVIVVPTTDPDRMPFAVIPIIDHHVYRVVSMVSDGLKLGPNPYRVYREEMVNVIYGSWPRPGGSKIAASAQTYLSLEEIAELVKNPQFIEVPA